MARQHLINLLSGIILLTCFTSSKAQQKSTPEKIIKGETGMLLDEKLTPYLTKTLNDYDLSGLSVGVVKDGEIVYAKAFGYQNMQSKQPMKITSVFHTASVSKLFVATAIMQLVEQGKVALNAPVVQYLPYFKLDDERYKDITVHQMLSHVSGMPDTDDYQWDKPRYDEKALEEYVKSLSSEKLIYPPKTQYAYSNIAFECLGDIISKVSGMSFEAYQEKYILRPSGMNESTFLKTEGLPENWAAPHVRLVTQKPWDVYPYNRMHAPSSTLHANIIDMSNWAITNLNKGTFQNKSILRPESYDTLWTPWVTLRPGRSIGLSWFLNEYKGEKTAEHSGSDVGFTSNFVLIPDKSIGVIVLCNSSEAPLRSITNAAINTILGHEIESGIIPISIPITKEFEKNGIDAAVELWNKLNEESPDKYDFDPDTFATLFYAMYMEQEKDAKDLAEIVKRIFPDEIIDYVKSEASSHLANVPDSKAAAIVLEVMNMK